MRGGLRIPALVAALSGAAALRVERQQRSAVDEFRRLCGGGSPPADLVERGLDCDPEFKRYDMDEWIAKHGLRAPDHPAVFTGTHTHEKEVFPDAETFLAKHGDYEVTALPEYATSGGALKHPFAQGRVTASFRQLTQTWNDSFVYFSDFKCHEDSLCHQVAEQFGKPRLFATKSLRSRNFLVGGPDSGLPFHKHGMTWQGLAMGRKAWYILPAGTMSRDMHDATGPYIFPVRAFHHTMQQRPLGERPLFCIQHPGETLFIPDYWWHSTMNLDAYQVAYGEKPNMMKQNSSAELAEVLRRFPNQTFDTGGRSADHGDGPTRKQHPMPYTLMPRQEHVSRSCDPQEITSPEFGVEDPLERMRNLTGSNAMQCGLAETAAWAHCMLANWGMGMSRSCGSAAVDQTIQEAAGRWRRAARELSPTLVNRERTVCGVAEA